MPDFNDIYRNAATQKAYERAQRSAVPSPVAEKLAELTNEAMSYIEAVKGWISNPKIVIEPKPLTFMAKGGCTISHNHPAAEAVKLKRIGCEIAPNREITGADFADYGDRILLAELGYFSIDLPKKREAMDREAQRIAYLEEAYDVLHLDRTAVHNMIAAKMEATKTDGIWAKSTGEYAVACRRMDMTVLARSPAIAQSILELNHAM